MPIKQISGAIGFIIFVFLMACDDGNKATVVTKPPYTITKPMCEIIERPGYFNYAGIVFNFLNTSDKIVDEVKVSFMLFEANSDENPFIGSNIFEITMLTIVAPKENKEIIISLDQYITIAPSEPYLIDFFYISEIHYKDGSTWQDKHGIYGVK